jgi:hypothetical protein
MTSHPYVLILTTWCIVNKQDIPSIDTHFQPYDLSLSWSHIPALVVPVRIALTTGCCCLGRCWTKDAYWFSITSKVLPLPRCLASPLRNIFVAMYRGYVTRITSTSRSVPLLWLIAGYIARIALRVPLVEQELLTLL